MRCSNCGADISGASNFCGNCGNSVEPVNCNNEGLEVKQEQVSAENEGLMNSVPLNAINDNVALPDAGAEEQNEQISICVSDDRYDFFNEFNSVYSNDEFLETLNKDDGISCTYVYANTDTLTHSLFNWLHNNVPADNLVLFSVKDPDSTFFKEFNVKNGRSCLTAQELERLGLTNKDEANRFDAGLSEAPVGDACQTAPIDAGSSEEQDFGQFDINPKQDKAPSILHRIAIDRSWLFFVAIFFVAIAAGYIQQQFAQTPAVNTIRNIIGLLFVLYLLSAIIIKICYRLFTSAAKPCPKCGGYRSIKKVKRQEIGREADYINVDETVKQKGSETDMTVSRHLEVTRVQLYARRLRAPVIASLRTSEFAPFISRGL